MAQPFVTITGTEALTRRLLELGADAPKAATRAINRTLVTVRTFAQRGLGAKLGVPQKLLAKSLWTWRAKVNDQIGVFRVGTRRLKSVDLKVQQRASDVAYRYRKEYRDIASAVSGPFIARMPSGHRGIFVRSTRPPEKRGGPHQSRRGKFYTGAWLPIGEVYGPPLSDVFQRELLQGALTKGQEALAKNLDHEIGEIIRTRAQAGND